VLQGNAEEQIGNKTAATSDFKRVLQFPSANPEQILHAAQGLDSMSFYADALSVVEYGIAIYPNFWELHQTRADIEMDLGNDQDTMREFQLALQLAPGQRVAAVLRDRGDYYRLRQQYKLATADYGRGINADPSYYPNFEGRALARLASSNDLASVISDFTSAIDLYEALHSPSRWPLASLYEQRAKVYVQQSRKDKAIIDFEKALSIVTSAGPPDWQARLRAEITSAQS
jgi:tetratricopeptide (TPR) repeat protein